MRASDSCELIHLTSGASGGKEPARRAPERLRPAAAASDQILVNLPSEAVIDGRATGKRSAAGVLSSTSDHRSERQIARMIQRLLKNAMR